MLPSAIMLPVMLLPFRWPDKLIIHIQTHLSLPYSPHAHEYNDTLLPIQPKNLLQNNWETYRSSFTCFHQAEDISNAPSWHARSGLRLLETKEQPLRKQKKKVLILQLRFHVWALKIYCFLAALRSGCDRRATCSSENRGRSSSPIGRWGWVFGASHSEMENNFLFVRIMLLIWRSREAVESELKIRKASNQSKANERGMIWRSVRD